MLKKKAYTYCVLCAIIAILIGTGMLFAADKEDGKSAAVKLMRASPEEAQQASKRLAELLQDPDFGVRCQAAFTTVRLGQRLAEKLRSPQLEQSLTKMISQETEAKNDAQPAEAEITEGRGVVWTVKRAFPTITRDAKIEEDQQRKRALFMGPCLYSGIQSLGEIRASSSEAFDLLKRLLKSKDKGVRSASAYAIATLDRPTKEKLKVLQDKLQAESEKDVKEYIEGSIAILKKDAQ